MSPRRPQVHARRPLPRRRRSLAILVGVVAMLVPASASAWTVAVDVRGAGKVDELTPRNLIDCETSANTSESAITRCLGGTPNGLYNSGDIVNLQASVPQYLQDRGWRFEKWVDSSASGQINCDPQGQTGNHLAANCQFQVWENIEVDLYFDDTFGPNDTTITSRPDGQTNSTDASFAFDAGDDPDALYDCKLDPPGPDPVFYSSCGSPSDRGESYSGLAANGQYTFYVRGRDPSGNLDETPASYTWTVDTVAPIVSIGGTPANGATTSSTGASFTVTASQGTPTCTLDGFATGCGSPKTGLADGSHTFVARATDVAQNTGSQSRSWTVDTRPPALSITSGPSATTDNGFPSFGFSAETGAAVQCSIDQGAPAFGSCSGASSHSPDLALADGAYTFRVRATDGAGNQTTQTRSFTVDASPTDPTDRTDSTEPADPTADVSPETTITGRPKKKLLIGGSRVRLAFAFASSENGSTFECRLDRKPWSACTSPKRYRVKPGKHTFRVAAIDPAGKRDPSPAVWSWQVKRR